MLSLFCCCGGSIRKAICDLGTTCAESRRPLTVPLDHQRAANWMVENQIGDYNAAGQFVLLSQWLVFKTCVAGVDRVKEPELPSARSVWSLRRTLSHNGWSSVRGSKGAQVSEKVFNICNTSSMYLAILLDRLWSWIESSLWPAMLFSFLLLFFFIMGGLWWFLWRAVYIYISYIHVLHLLCFCGVETQLAVRIREGERVWVGRTISSCCGIHGVLPSHRCSYDLAWVESGAEGDECKGLWPFVQIFCRLNSFVACGSVHYNSWIAIVFIIKSSQTHKYVLEIVDKDWSLGC